MAGFTKRPWFWFAGMALMLALPHAASAEVVVGDGSGVFLDTSAIDAAPVSRGFSAFSRPALLMPGEAPTESIVLTPPGGRKGFGARPLLTPPRGGAAASRLLVPENRRIVLTPPAGAPVRLTPPSSDKVRLTAPGTRRLSALSTAKTARPAKPKPAAKPAREKPLEQAMPEPPVTKPAPPAAEPVAPVMAQPTPTPAPAAPAAAQAPAAPEPPAAKPVAAPAQRSALPAPPPAKPAETPAPALPATAEPMPLIPPAADTAKAPAPAPAAEPPAPAAPMVEAPSTPIADIPAAPAPAAPLEPMTTIAVATPKAIPAPPAGADSRAAATPKASVILNFDASDARLNETHRALLKDIAVRLNEDADASVQLLAYAQAENRSKARRLSLSRALAVRSYLLSQDVRNTRIEVRALGDQVPAGKPDRVDVILQRP